MKFYRIGIVFFILISFKFMISCTGEKDVKTDLESIQKLEEVQLSDEALLDSVQKQTFKYFWDYAHPTSGLTRERASLSKSGTDEVTTGGTGFGVMAIIVGIERGFISKEEGLERLLTIVSFLEEKADRFHGAWPHWINGTTGKTIPFSKNDDGGDLVETAFMFQGLLAVRQYFSGEDEKEGELRNSINKLWSDMEWDWYTQGGQKGLFWHWSPNYAWEKNHKITGWNEALIVYVLAASSETHGIQPDVYHEGWARSGEMINGKKFYNWELPLGFDYGGPLFFAHYSFLGLDPRNLKDRYANYWQQNLHHTQINRQYCIENPKGFEGYHKGSWGLTASYSINFYNAHSPTNDTGVISPTAALSSFPYTPKESMEALRWMFAYENGKLWNKYGFIDAYSISDQWFSDGYLAIDQGPIIVMIENYRSGLMWELFMSCPEIQGGLKKLGFDF